MLNIVVIFLVLNYPISQSSYVTDEPSNFVLNFIGLFSDCTIHFSRSIDESTMLYRNWVNSCAKGGIYCAMLHSYIDDSDFLSEDSHISNLFSTQFSIPYQSKVSTLNHQQVYSNLKYQHHCNLQIVGVPNITMRKLSRNQLFAKINPDFVVFSLPEKEFSKTISVHESSTSTYFMFLERVEEEFFVSLTPQAEFSLPRSSKVVVPFVHFDFKIISNELNDFKYSMLKRQSFLFNMLEYKLKHSDNYDKTRCRYLFFDLNEGLRPEKRYHILHCIKDLISKAINCTSALCSHHLNNLKNGLFSTASQENYYRIFSYGVTFTGNRFSIFIKKKQSTAGTSSFSGLVKTISLNICILLLCAFLLIILIFRLSGYHLHSSFWLVATLLEQEGDARSKCTKVNWQVILLWLLLGNILRFWYTSFMFSNMTTDPGPIIEYDTFKDIIQETETTFIAKVSVRQYLYQIYSHAWNHMGIIAESQRESLYEVIRRLSATESPELVIKSISQDNFIGDTCTHHKLIEKDFKIPKTGAIIIEFLCLKPEAFVYLYRKSDGSTLAHVPSQISKLMVYQLGRYYLHETQEIVDTDPIGWYSLSEGAFRPQIDSILKSVTESGIYEHENDILESIGMKSYLKYYFREYNMTVSQSNLVRSIFLFWKSNGCFRLFKESCVLTNLEINESSFVVHGGDVVVVWILHGTLCLIAFFVFAFEKLYFKQRIRTRFVKREYLVGRLKKYSY